MANILVFNHTVPYPAHLSGNTLRVFPLSRELARNHRCFLAAFGQLDDHVHALAETGVFEDIFLLPPRVSGGSPLRHLFLTTGQLARVAQPAYYRSIVKRLESIVQERRIDLLLVHTSAIAEYVLPINRIPKVLDAIDSPSLAMKRQVRWPDDEVGWRPRVLDWLRLARARSWESRLGPHFEYITVVSPIDREAFQQLNPAHRERIVDIPNGVTSEALEREFSGTEIPDSIAFWGALDFPPNRLSVHYFFDKVYSRHLAHRRITWYVVGRNPDSKMLSMSAKHTNIVVPGFVDDLYGLVSRVPIMVNLMKSGSGLKNKVIEAFALGRCVVSNSMGMEAVNAVDGIHYVRAEEPKDFASQILRLCQDPSERARIGREARRLVSEEYTWEKVGRKFNGLLAPLVSAED